MSQGLLSECRRAGDIGLELQYARLNDHDNNERLLTPLASVNLKRQVERVESSMVMNNAFVDRQSWWWLCAIADRQRHASVTR